MILDDLIKGAKGVEQATNGKINAGQVYHLVRTNRLPVIRKGRAMFFRKSELERAFSSEDTQTA